MPSTFRPEELVKVQGKQYPVVGGRLRLAHDENSSLDIDTEVLLYNEEYTVVQAHVTTNKGKFSGIGNASVKRDRVLSLAILELAETRAIARALRFAGYGVEYTGFEEVSHVKNQSETDEDKASKTQLKEIFQIAREINMKNEDLQELIQVQTGKRISKDLSKKEAALIIDSLREKQPENAGNKMLQ